MTSITKIISQAQIFCITRSEWAGHLATVKTHINSLLGKLGVTDRTQAATAAIQRGLVPLESLRRTRP